MIDTEITENEERIILPEKYRSRRSAKEFNLIKKNYLLSRYRGLINPVTNDLLLAILETNTKILFLLKEKL